jgi:hypothetical protein
MILMAKQEEEEAEKAHHLVVATRLLAGLTPRIRAALERAPLRVQLGRLALMQPHPTHTHVVYAEPDISSADGRSLRAVCGTCRLPSFPPPHPSPPCLELVRDAFTEAGFLAVDCHPLQVCRLAAFSQRYARLVYAWCR